MVNATAQTTNSTYVALASLGTGAATDYNVSISVTDSAPTYSYFLTDPSFTAAAEDMSGGTNAEPTSWGTIYSYEAGYAPNGNILTHTDSVMGTWNFSYDAVDRLTAATAGANAPTPFQSQTASWTYDAFGNRTAQTFSNGAYSNWAHYNLANNRIASSSQATGGYVYDASGNTLYDGQNEYWYDAEGQQCAVQGKAVAGMTAYQYLYDAEGARITKFTLASPPAQYTPIGTNLGSSPSCAPPPAAALAAPGYSGSGVSLNARYLVGLGGDQVTELNMSSGALVWTHSNIFAGTRLTATYDRSGLHYELADPLGTKRLQTNITGIVEEWYASLPFGDALTTIPNSACTTANYCNVEDATEHHFTGKERDTESGNDYFGARYYSSAMGRFMSPDWSAKAEPVPYAKLDNPQSLNLYAYVLNNPLSHTDPDGHTCKGGDRFCNVWDFVFHHDKRLPPPPPSKVPPPGVPAPPPLTFKPNVPVPAPNSGLGKLLQCTNQCMNPVPIGVSSTSETVPGHPEIHGSDTPHGRGEAADLTPGKSEAKQTLWCSAQCGAGFGQNEYDHPSAHATGAHDHIQTGEGRGGSRGDLPANEHPEQPQEQHQ